MAELDCGRVPSRPVQIGQDDLGVERGQAITAGVCPENAFLERDSQKAADPTEPMDAIVDVLEPMGDEVFAYMLLGKDVEASPEGRGEGQLLMSLSPDTVIGEGEEVRIVLDRSKIHLFDTDSGQAITHGIV